MKIVRNLLLAAMLLLAAGTAQPVQAEYLSCVDAHYQCTDAFQGEDQGLYCDVPGWGAGRCCVGEECYVYICCWDQQECGMNPWVVAMGYQTACSG